MDKCKHEIFKERANLFKQSENEGLRTRKIFASHALQTAGKHLLSFIIYSKPCRKRTN